MKNKDIKLEFSSLFENPNGLQGEELLVESSWAIVTVKAEQWGSASVLVVNPNDAKKEDINNPEDLIIYFKEGIDVPKTSKDFKLSWENGTKPNQDVKISEDGVAEISYGGYGDDGIAIEINYFLFKDVSVEKIKNLLENTFNKDMRNLINELESEAEDDELYRKDPNAYYGVSSSDFVSPSEMKRKF